MNSIRTAAVLVGVLGAKACTTDMDCSLNGLCQTGKCVCDAGWKGDSCAELNLFGGGQIWPKKGSTNTSSWGLSTITDDSGVVHTLVDVACGKSGVLTSGGGGSFITHLTSDSVEGDKTVKSMFSVPVSFGPHLWKGPSKSYVVFRVNAIPEPGPSVCPGNGSLPYPHLYDGAILKPPAIKPMPPGEVQPDIWIAETNNIAADDWTVNPAFIKNVGNIHVSNPSVTYSKKIDRHLMAFRMNLDSEAIGIAVSDSGTNATSYSYTFKVNCTACEDPFIWVDARDNYHVLWHRGPHGGHAFSKSATGDYVTSPVYPFTLNVTYADGSKEVFKRRERPEIQFDENKTPKHFYSGVYDQNGFAYTLQQELH